MLRYRRKIPSKFDLRSTAKKVTVKKGKTVYRQNVTVMLRYRPVQVRQKYRYRTPPWIFPYCTMNIDLLPIMEL